MNDADLKPCPFCGGFAKFDSETKCYGHGEYHRIHFIRCTSCGAKSPSEVEHLLSADVCKIIVGRKWNERNG